MSIGSKKAESFYNKRQSISGNTSVRIDPSTGEVHMILFGNLIAIMDANRTQLSITNAGWKTVTTKDRLNHVLSACGVPKGIQQIKGTWYVNTYKTNPYSLDTQEEWDGNFLTINI